MTTTVVLAALVVAAAAAQGHDVGTTGSTKRAELQTGDHNSPSSSYSSVILHKDESSAKSGNSPEEWAYSQVHINFPKDKESKPQAQAEKQGAPADDARGKTSLKTTSQSVVKHARSDDGRKVADKPSVSDNDVQIDNVGEESSPHSSTARQDYVGSSVNVGYSIGVAPPPVNPQASSASTLPRVNTYVTDDRGPQKATVTSNIPSAHSYSVSNLSLGRGIHKTAQSNTNPVPPTSSILGEVITGRPSPVLGQGLPANTAQDQLNQKYHSSYVNQPENNAPTLQYHHSNDARLYENNNGQFGLRHNLNKLQLTNDVNRGQFRNNANNAQFHSQTPQQNQNNNFQSHNINNGHGEFISGGTQTQGPTAGKAVYQNSLVSANNVPVNAQYAQHTPNNNNVQVHPNNNNVQVHNPRNSYSNVGSSSNQVHSLVPSRGLPQNSVNQADNFQTNVQSVQQNQNNNNVLIHNPSNSYSGLAGASNLAYNLGPSKTLSQTYVNNAEQVHTNGQGSQNSLNNNNVQFHSAVNSYREFNNNNNRLQNQIASNGQLQYVNNADNKNTLFNGVNNLNSNNFHNNFFADKNRSTPGTKDIQTNIPLRGTTIHGKENCPKEQTKNPLRYLGNVQKNGNPENLRHPNSGTSYINFNLHKNHERNPDSSISATNYQQSVVQSKPVSFGVTSSDISNVNSLPWRHRGVGVNVNSGNIVQGRGNNEGSGGDNVLAFNNFQSRHPPVNAAPTSLSSSAQNQAIFYVDSDKQNSNVLQHTATKGTVFDHANALGSSNIFGHRDAIVSQTQKSNNLQQVPRNQISQNAASTGNVIAQNQKLNFNSLHDYRFSGSAPNLNAGSRQQANVITGHSSAPQITSNNNGVTSDKEVPRVEHTVLNIPEQAIIPENSLALFDVNGIQPNPLLLNTGLLSYKTLTEGQNFNSPQQTGSFASLPGQQFPVSANLGLSNTNNNNLLAASNFQPLTAQVVPLNTHSSQTPSSVNHPVGGAVFGGHIIQPSSTATQPSFLSNLQQNINQFPQFFNPGNPTLPIANSNSVNLPFFNYQNFVPGPVPKQNLQIDKGTNQAVQMAHQNKESSSGGQVISHIQIPNFQFLPASLQVIQPVNHEPQKNIIGTHNHFNGAQQPIQLTGKPEGVNHIHQAGTNPPLRDENLLQNGHFLQLNQHFLQTPQLAADGNRHATANTGPNYDNQGHLGAQNSFQQFESHEPSYLQSNQQNAPSGQFPNQEINAPAQDTNGGSRPVFSGFVPDHRNTATVGHDALGIQSLPFHTVTSPRILLGGLQNGGGLSSSLLTFNRHGGFLRGANGRSLFSFKPQAKHNPDTKNGMSLSAGNQSSHLTVSEVFKAQSSSSPQSPVNNIIYSGGVQSNHETRPVVNGVQSSLQHGVSFHNFNTNLRQNHADLTHRPIGNLVADSMNQARQPVNGLGNIQSSFSMNGFVPSTLYVLNTSQVAGTGAQSNPQVQFVSAGDAGKLHGFKSAVEPTLAGSHLHSRGHRPGSGKDTGRRKHVNNAFQHTESIKPVSEPSEEADRPGSGSASLLAPGR